MSFAPNSSRDDTPQAEAIPEWALRYVEAALRCGFKAPSIEKKLVAKGLPARLAPLAVDRCFELRLEAIKDGWRRQFVIHLVAGLVALVVGVILWYETDARLGPAQPGEARLRRAARAPAVRLAMVGVFATLGGLASWWSRRGGELWTWLATMGLGILAVVLLNAWLGPVIWWGNVMFFLAVVCGCLVVQAGIDWWRLRQLALSPRSVQRGQRRAQPFETTPAE